MATNTMNLPSGFELDQQTSSPTLPPGFELDNQTNSSPGIWGAAKSIFNQYKQSPGYSTSPYGLLEKGVQYADQLAAKGGEKATEYLGSKGVDPYTSAGVGSLISAGPAMLQASAPEAEGAKAVESAVPFMRRSLGFTKPMLKTPFARGQAEKAAEIGLENKIMPWSGNPETALQNAQGMANKYGAQIGKTIEQTPASATVASQNLENVRQQLTSGVKTGVFEKVNNAIDSVKSSLDELASTGKQITAQQLNEFKTRIGNSVNYLADLASQSDNKAIVNNLANSIRDVVKEFSTPEEFSQFLNNQKMYSAAKLMMKGLNNEVAAQQGNKMFSPYSVIPATGELATGRPGKALATLGVLEPIIRRGAGTSARAIQEVGSNLPAITTLGANVNKRILDEMNIKRIWELSDHNPERAKQIAEAEGFEVK